MFFHYFMFIGVEDSSTLFEYFFHYFIFTGVEDEDDGPRPKVPGLILAKMSSPKSYFFLRIMFPFL